MARDSNGDYTLPAGNPVVSGTTISSTWANTSLSDIEAEITDSLSRSGKGAMTAPLELAAGSVAAPGLSFSLETNSGIFRNAAGDIRFVIGGVAMASMTSTGFAFNLGDATGTLLLGSASAAAKEQRVRLSNAAKSSGMELCLTADGATFGLYDRGATAWLLSIDTATGVITGDGSGLTGIVGGGGGDVYLAGAQTFTGTKTFTGDVFLTEAAANTRMINILTGTDYRWCVGCNETAEAGSDAGSDFIIYRFDDANLGREDSLFIKRSTGNMSLRGAVDYTAPITIKASSSSATTTGLTAYGGIHFEADNTTDDYFQGITFAGKSTGTQGGVLLQSSNLYGTRFIITTASNFGTGAVERYKIYENGRHEVYGATGEVMRVYSTTAAQTSGIRIGKQTAGGSDNNTSQLYFYRELTNTVHSVNFNFASSAFAIIANTTGLSYDFESFSTVKVRDGAALRIQDTADTDYLSISHNGTDVLLAGTNTTNVVFSGITALSNVAGTVSLPSYSFTGDLNTGLYSIGADNFGLAAGGVVVAQVKTRANGSLTVYDEGGTEQAVGFRDIPQNSQTAGYTLALADRGKHISITTGNVVIPANASVAFPIGSTVNVYNDSGSSQTISITTDTLRQAGTANTGTRTLPQYGIATLMKVKDTTWIITGTGVT